eukprot:TRINITY_DN13244_c0_g1_i1.p1 TRINITY_DN13244_c0_g1~~TRINITY_DN13244_c0_g1_i1.p1  ORF type:complete len:532 (+),score=192.93 TRINITY_DN13244_c0_g1_i1:29-1624(+)
MRSRSLWALLLLLSLSACVCAQTTILRGVSPDKLHLYRPAGGSNTVSCSDSLQIPISSVNDDFCDCPDNGFDEPGTSACNNGRFYCPNKGFEPKIISSSFVDDGICDCCDGSDEQLKGTKCKNTCKEDAYEAQKSTLEEVEIIKRGLALKKEIVHKAKGVWEEKKVKLAELKTEIAALKEELEKMEKLKGELKAQKAARDAAEEEEENDSGEDEKDATSTTSSSSTEEGEQEQEDESFPYPKEYRYTEEENKDGDDGDDDSEPAEHEAFPYPEEYRFHDTEEENGVDDDDDEDDDGPVDTGSDTIEDVDSSLFDKSKAPIPKKPVAPSNNNENDDDDDDEDDSAEPGMFENIMSRALSLFGLVKTEVDDPENLDANLKKVRQQVKKLKSEISSRENHRDNIDSDLAKDFGVDHEFSLWADKCVSVKVKQYDYEVCPYKDSKQKEGHSSTSLGNYEGWKEGEKYKTMLFTRGQKCWNGPHRSATVKFVCGDKDEVISADEPSVCAYEMILKTPVACSEVDLELLQARLKRYE